MLLIGPGLCAYPAQQGAALPCGGSPWTSADLGPTIAPGKNFGSRQASACQIARSDRPLIPVVSGGRIPELSSTRKQVRGLMSAMSSLPLYLRCWVQR
jgi:hypothetical protein